MRLSIQHEGGEDVQDVDGGAAAEICFESGRRGHSSDAAQGLWLPASQAWPLIAALRARDDIDVASSRRNVDAALVVRRRTATRHRSND